MRSNQFDILKFDKHYFTWKGIKRFFSDCEERLRYGVATSDTWDLRNYVAQVLIYGLTTYVENLHSVPQAWVDKEDEYKKYLMDTCYMLHFAIQEPCCPYVCGTPEYEDAMTKLMNQKQDCVNQAFERIAEVFMDLWD